MYTFTIFDATGCIGQDSLLVLSEPCFQEKLIPNVFTPNADNKNDIFYIPGVCPGDKYSVSIYDRWGVLIFSTTLRNNGWDGRTSSGIDAPDGVYYFVVTLGGLTDKQGNPIDDEVHKGFVTVVR
jgi:gliding motility-associated-like protein